MFEKNTILTAKSENLRDKAMTMFAAVRQLAYEHHIGTNGNHDEFIIALDIIGKNIRDGEYTGRDGQQRSSYKPFQDQIDYFNNQCGLSTWSKDEIEALALRFYERQAGLPPVGSGSYAERQDFQSDDIRDTRPEYANADLYKANRLEERIKEVESRIDKLQSREKLNRFEMKTLSDLNESLVDLYDQLREVS